jgi:hypothetical protein
MPAALKSTVYRSQSPRPSAPLQVVPTRAREQSRSPRVSSAAPELTALPTPVRGWRVRCLQGLYQGSKVMAGGLMGASLALYSWTVYVERQVNQQNRALASLESRSQQLTAANALLKHHLATAAESPDVGLQPAHPDLTIFLQPAPGRSAVEAQAEPRLKEQVSPLGY